MTDCTTEQASAQRCTKCGLEKPLTDFWKNSSTRTGFHPTCRTCNREYRQSDRGKEVQAACQRRYIANKSKDPEWLSRRRFQVWSSRTKKRGAAICDLTYEQWRQRLGECGHRCVYCGKEFDERNLTIDHVLPIARGGNNTLANVVPACYGCNLSKSDRTPVEAVMPFVVRVDLFSKMEQLTFPDF